ncbi:ABC transporter permease [Xanthovirga aplysinae]|uniref:ABC transporter permease n=1 Tax=Xanthovirga aplysinae TaxID=2529853 RepID=UPI0012BC59C7|nr:ABC transporter permease [Xanthovirga aplysinae]MTI32855.1 ABC transporter permease [Xanthovirga aplysinae]
MIKNYLKIALRNLLKHRFYSLLNLLGLAVGMACCLLIFFYVQFEMNYDSHHPKIDRLYRVYLDFTLRGEDKKEAILSYPAAEALKNDFPEVKQSTRIRKWFSGLIKYKDNSHKIEKTAYSDPSLLEMFSIPLIKGDPKTALSEPNTLIIDEETASKIFVNEDPLGKTILLDNRRNYKVSGVFENIPEQSHFHYSVFYSMAARKVRPNDQSWMSSNFITYIELNENASAKELEGKLEDLVNNYVKPEFEQKLGVNLEENIQGGNRLNFKLQPVKDIHLKSSMLAEHEPNGSMTVIYVFSAIAILILLIACINYMNLATACSVERAKEVGIRKTMGALGKQLVGQFLSESLLLSILSLCLAIGLVELSLPAFNQLAEKSISTHYWNNWPLLLSIGGIILLVGIISGSYPAFYLSAFNPVKVLKGSLNKSSKTGNFRSSLVVFQFGVSIFLLVATTVIYKQLGFIQNADPGFNKEQVLILHDAYALGNQVQPFKEELLRSSLFKSGTVSGYLPLPSPDKSMSGYSPEGQQSENGLFNMRQFYTDYDYVKTFGMKLVQGRFFSPDFPSDSSAIVINEVAVKKLGYVNPLGKKAYPNGDKEGKTIIGVVKDFNYESMREDISPLAFYLGRSTGNISFRIDGNRASEAITLLESQWKQMAPGEPFQYSFLDDRFNKVYQEDQRTGEIVAVFSGLAIFIACLGLFGLAAFTAEKRRKEIGIRKVLGSSIQAIVVLLSKDFVKLVLIAFVIASPIAWWVMNDWLQAFAFRTSLGPGVFAIAGLLSFLVAWITMSYHAIKAATDDPVNSIRYE